MVRSLTEEFNEYLEKVSGDDKTRNITLATGVLAAPIIKGLTDKMKDKFPNTKITVYTITNEFFGPDITVAGLLTGQDIIKQLTGKDLGDALILPNVLLRSGEDILLDDLRVKDIENALQTPIRIVKSDGVSLIDTIIS